MDTIKFDNPLANLNSVHIPFLAILFYFYVNENKTLNFTPNDYVLNFKDFKDVCEAMNIYANYLWKITGFMPHYSYIKCQETNIIEEGLTLEECLELSFGEVTEEEIKARKNRKKDITTIAIKLTRNTNKDNLKNFFEYFIEAYTHANFPTGTLIPTIFDCSFLSKSQLEKISAYIENYQDKKENLFRSFVEQANSPAAQNPYKNLENYFALKDEFCESINFANDLKNYKIEAKFLPIVIVEYFNDESLIRLKSFDVKLFNNTDGRLKKPDEVKILAYDTSYGMPLLNEDIFEVEINANISNFCKYNMNPQTHVKTNYSKDFSNILSPNEKKLFRLIKREVSKKNFSIHFDDILECFDKEYETNKPKTPTNKRIGNLMQKLNKKMIRIFKINKAGHKLFKIKNDYVNIIHTNEYLINNIEILN